jgi:hypothetical protein
MSDLQAKFDQMINEQRELQKKFQEQGRALFKEIFKEFFDKNPSITVVKWTQYTPYFNDGDECVFGVNDPVFSNATGDDIVDVNPWGEYEGENEEVWAVNNPKWVLQSDSYYYKEDQVKLRKSNIDVQSCDLLSTMIQSSEMKNVLRGMFDDHVSVIATRDGFDVQEYDHD